jgi:hypothetical protein
MSAGADTSQKRLRNGPATPFSDALIAHLDYLDALALGMTPTVDPKFTAKPFVWRDPKSIPPRGWLHA